MTSTKDIYSRHNRAIGNADKLLDEAHCKIAAWEKEHEAELKTDFELSLLAVRAVAAKRRSHAYLQRGERCMLADSDRDQQLAHEKHQYWAYKIISIMIGATVGTLVGVSIGLLVWHVIHGA